MSTRSSRPVFVYQYFAGPPPRNWSITGSGSFSRKLAGAGNVFGTELWEQYARASWGLTGISGQNDLCEQRSSQKFSENSRPARRPHLLSSTSRRQNAHYVRVLGDFARSGAEVRNVDGCLHIARKPRQYDEWDPYVPPYDLHGPGCECNR
jgi:hypothetical protein